MAARRAQVMRSLQLAAIGAFGVGRGGQRVMRSPHVAARGRGFLFRNSHAYLIANSALRIAPPQARNGERKEWRYLAKFRGGGNSDGVCWANPGNVVDAIRNRVSHLLPPSRSTSRISPANGRSRTLIR